MAPNTDSTGTTSINAIVNQIENVVRAEKGEGESNVCPKCEGEGRVFRRDSRGFLFASDCPLCRKVQKDRVRTALKLSGIPELGVGREIVLAPEIDEYARQFKRSGFSDWLVLSGKPGAGKTTQAARLGKRIICQGGTVRFYNAFNLTRRLIANRKRAADFDRDLDDFRDADLVVLDDFLKSVPARTSYDFNDFYSITCELIWTRYDDRKPLVVTTQKTFNDVALFDSALASRIVEMGKGRFVTMGRGATNYRLQPK